MRVIGGQYRGIRLRAPRGLRARPTTDRVKESLFAILRHDTPGARVLDLFAGSGALGIEALSRGARHATFVDSHAECVDAVRGNLSQARVDEQSALVLKMDAGNALTDFERRGETFGVVFVDPPYDSNLANEALRRLGLSRTADPDGVVVVEHDRRAAPADYYGRLTRVRVEDYGDTVISFFRQVDPASV